MEIFIRHNESKKPGSVVELEAYEIVSCKVLSQPSSILLICDSEMEVKEGETAPFFEIFKVEFIAFCETDRKMNFVGAFYLDEYSNALACRVVSELPANLVQDGGIYWMVDYKSYTEICLLTGEMVLPFKEFLIKKRGDSGIMNSLIQMEEKLLNFDEINALL